MVPSKESAVSPKHQAVDSGLLEGLDVPRDLLRRPRESLPPAIAGRLGLSIVVPRGAVGEADLRRLPARLLGVAVYTGLGGGQLLQARHRKARVAAYGKPGVAKACGASQRRRTLAADPYGRMWALDRPGEERDVRETAVLPSKVGLSLVHSSLKARMYSSPTAPRSS